MEVPWSAKLSRFTRFFESREDEYTKVILVIPLLSESDLEKADE
jgi:hypothetical protein